MRLKNVKKYNSKTILIKHQFPRFIALLFQTQYEGLFVMKKKKKKSLDEFKIEACKKCVYYNTNIPILYCVVFGLKLNP